MTRVAIQGEAGSYSHEAAATWFGAGVEILGCDTFGDVFEAVAIGRAARAVLPVENTIVGPIVEITTLLERYRLRPIGEVALRVEHCLVVPGGDRRPPLELEGRIRRIASHPIALAQCRRFLRARPRWQTIETADTAGAVRSLAAGRLRADAVIASRAAAERYGCRVVQAAIQDEAVNVTSFLVLETRATTAVTPAPPSLRAEVAARFREVPDPYWRAGPRR